MPIRKAGVLWAVIVFFMFLLGGPVTAHAHFLLNLNVRILHVEHLADGLRVYLRTPMPYLVAGRIGPVGADGLPKPAPFTSNRMENDKVLHFLDFDQLRSDPNGIGIFAAEGFRIEADGNFLDATVEQAQVFRIGTQPDFATLDEAKVSFNLSRPFPEEREPLYVGDSVADIILRYDVGESVHSYAISSTLNPGLPDQEKTANLILDYGPGSIKVFRARGLLAEPINISRSALSAIFTFVKEGFRHILEGLDHVLFVLCLVLGAVQLKSLVWRATGFTIGHSITLSAGFFGFVPNGAWFVPTIETGIALSIIYAAVIAMVPNNKLLSSERNMFFVTCLIGLLHGLGFSFVLNKILQIESPDIWQSLLAFNVGVEIGQLVIILAAWPVFRLIQKLSEKTWRIGRMGIASVCIAVGAMWTMQRILLVVGTI